MNKINNLFKRKRVWLIVLFIVFVYLNNSSYFVKEQTGDPVLLAHRGLAQTFPMEGIANDTCTAERIYVPEHPYLENTISSMKTAFESGADIVEFDVQPTIDKQFAIFHDWTLECRTNGKGVTRDYTLEELKSLDIGYGYTADNGKTFPFRGKGVGMLPSINQVMSEFPNESFLIHIKSNDPTEGKLLSQYLSQFPSKRLEQLAVYGGDEPIAVIEQQLPELRTMSKASLKSCLIPYLTTGWSGYVPSACKKTQLHIPEKIAPLLWGWPNRFMDRMDKADTRVILVAGNGKFSEGFDSVEDTKRIPSGYKGGIWTNRIDKIANQIK